MKRNRIVIVGGVAAGPKTASRARRRDPHAEITIIERGKLLSYAGCGLPYYVEGKVPELHDLMSTAVGVVRDPGFFKAVNEVHVMNETLVEQIDRERKVVKAVRIPTGERLEVPYDKLVLATGGTPIEPPLSGTDLHHVFRLYHPDDALAMRAAVERGGIKQAVLIGGGLIGMETAEALAERGLEVTIVEMLDQLLPAMLDWEMAAFLEKYLRGRGIQIRLNEKVTALEGNAAGNVTRVQTTNGTLPAQLVLLAIGVRPNAQLAKAAGLALGPTGAIAVNELLQTTDPDIYAGGDCVENMHRVSGQKVFIPLGSTANKHGRVIGDNVTCGQTSFRGVTGTTVFKIFDFNLARAGLTEKQARAAGEQVVTALVPGPDRAHYYPTHATLLVKLVARASDGKLLGAQVIGPGDAVKRIDVIATALHFGATIEDLADLDLGYAPPYSTAVDPLAQAANVVRNKRDGIAVAVTPQQLKAKLETDEPFVLVDVRTPAELQQMALSDPRVVHIPLGKLRERAGELPRDREIICFCKVSVRGYEAQRILQGLGFADVKFLDGGLVAWPYPLKPVAAPSNQGKGKP